MNGFADRLRLGTEFESEVFEALLVHEKVTAVVNNGTEHTHPEFVDGLRGIGSAASKFVRYAPDGVLQTSTGDVLHYDAKASKAIEKNAYEVYMSYVSVGCRVLLFVRHDDGIYWTDVEDMTFKDSHEVVGQFPEQRRFPVVDGWIAPREKPGFRSTNRMSGTPYKEIDPACLKKWAPSQVETPC